MSNFATLEVQAPQRLKMSYEEYLRLAPESRIVEWVNGEVIRYMPPVYQHQDIVAFLVAILRDFVAYFSLGKLISSPFEVKLWPNGPSREPDILFIAAASLDKLTPERFEGGPDLLIEIISPGSVTEDRVRKFSEYERAGVREYWLIDPRPHQQQADFYLLDANQSYQPVPLDEAGVYTSSVLPNLHLRLAWLWQEPLPSPQLILAEIMLSIDSLPDEARSAFQGMYDLLQRR